MARPRATPQSAQRAAQPLAVPREVQVSLDGTAYSITMTRAEERAMRRSLQPYIDHARLVAVASGVQEAARTDLLSARMRQARVDALLGLSSGPPRAEGDAQMLDKLVERTAEIYARSLAAQTRATYRRRWTAFCSWCEQQALTSLPADAATVMAYLAAQIADSPPPSLSTLRGQVNAINRVHQEMDLRRPSDDPALAMLMRGLSRSVSPSAATEQMSALRIEELRAVCRHLDHPDPVVIRDAALLRLHLAGVALPVLARLRWDDVRFDTTRVLLGERQAKNGSVTSWREVKALPDTSRCPVAALQRWRSIAGTSPRLVFTLVDRDGRRDSRGLGPKRVQEVFQIRCESLGPQTPGQQADLARVADALHEVATSVLRDRAILLLGFAIAARRGELTNLTWADIRFVDEGLLLRLRHSKTDLDGRGTTVGVPWGRSLLTCPVRALLAWQERLRHQLGEECTGDTSVFVKVGRAGRITVA